jgi:hypothetical protein
MATFYKTSTLWVVDYQYEGRARRWFKALGPDQAAASTEMARVLQDLYGQRARLVQVRRPTDEEELQYLRGQEPKNVFCPTGHTPVQR